ncbi:hypothetical protein J3F84DRAFT_408593 [Trichoderma pleuroticola]
MDSMDPSFRNIANNSFGDNVTIHQNNVQNPAADQTDQCLKDLRLTDPRDDKTRIQQTKGGLLKESSDWIFENDTFTQWRDDERNTLLWIKGDPGKGKTMLLCAIIDELTPRTKLGKPMDRTTNNTFLSYFFCQGTDSRINNATAVLRGLIYLTIIQEPSLVLHVQEKYNHAALSEMLQNILCDQKVRDIVLVLDALDECETDSTKLLDLITQHASLPHVKWIISSRNILTIQQRLERYMSRGILSLELKANAETVSNAVDIYIEHRISCLHSIQHNQGLIDELRDALRQKANGTFLWVSLVVKELEDVQSWEVMEAVKEMPMDLTEVYRRMIGQVRNQRRGNAKLCWNILSTIFTAYYPLSLGELGILAGLPKEISEHLESIMKLVTMCGSFLTIRQGIIYFIHQSAKDFLSAEAFQSDAVQRHTDIYEQSNRAISTLPQNIYGLPDFGFQSEHAWTPEPSPLASMRYSCFCWIGHFCDAYGENPESETRLTLKEKLWSFLKDHVLRWLESMILLGGLADALRALQKMVQELQFDTDSRLSDFLRSTEKFIIKNGPVITRAPLQVYGSALVFGQASSDVNQRQWRERLPIIEDIKGIIETNDALLQTLEGHASAVTAVRFSLDGKVIASCCRSGTVQVWDATTGAILHTLTTNDHTILAVSFSPAGKSFTFVSITHNLLDRRSNLFTVSLDNKIPLSQLVRSDIRLHGEMTYGLAQMFTATMSARATFSIDGKMLAMIVRSDGPIKLWNAVKCVPLRAFQNFSEPGAAINALAFSPDSKIIASGHANATVNLWDTETGARFKRFTTSYPPSFPSINGIAFQRDSKKLVIGHMAPSQNIRVLDIATGRDQETHINHEGTIRAIAFSPDGRTMAVGSRDGTVRLWDVNIGMRPRITGDTARPKTEATGSKVIEKMVFSPDGKTLALSTTSLCREVELWDTSNGACQNTFEVPHGLLDQQSMETQTRLLLWETHCTAIAFSPNGEELASSISGFEIQLQNLATGEVQTRFGKSMKEVHAITFLPEGKTLAAVYDEDYVVVWDVTTGACLREFCLEVPGSFLMGPASMDRYTSIKYLPDGPFLCLNHRYIINLSEKIAESPKHDLLLIDEEWITKGEKSILWLPKEYRSNVVATQGDIVAIGHESGITFIRFNFSAPKGL